MSCPLFFVVARVVGYYWGHDLSASEPDTLWGLEGYTHPAGFFLGHTSTDVFKREMRLADEQKLLKTVQGIGSPDYDLHHYDLAGGWLKREDDPGKDSRDSAVAVVYFWAAEEGRREEVVRSLEGFAKAQRERAVGEAELQSCAVLREVMDRRLATLWLRTKTQQHLKSQLETKDYKDLLATLQPLTVRTETHLSQVFNGHIDQPPTGTGA
ncbi:hypothetical protein HER10_EVM0013442 [Colletotrichum scovillei]|uniref:uncharacterized protein n=1 Tax=Colletotrichum scovillei TaxID=1209932 RepID=UPI0015C36DA9|nr:uncharacterized protein HER10_EVM0013442 [Colletotrichum scovillei]KAF4783758.1 hypothetical protein HER10_EVM0013442 [Colletotrichum scovillei]